MLVTLMWGLTSGVPYALMGVAGFLLWRRGHSVATAIVAVGFAVAFLSQVVGLLVQLETDAFVRAYRDDGTFVTVHAHAFPQFARYCGLVGFWVGALGLLLHSVPSPNNRWRGP